VLLDLYPAYNALWGTVAASVPVQAASAVALSLDAAVTGPVPVTAATTCALSLGATVTGSTHVRAAATCALSLSGTVAASVPTQATALSALSLAGVVAGSVPVQAAATATLTITVNAVIAVQLPTRASAVGALSLGATVTGPTSVTASGAGGLSLSGIGACEVSVTCAATGRSRFAWYDRARTRVTAARSLTLATVTASTTAATVARSLTLATPTASLTAATVTRSTTEARLVSTTYTKRLGDTLPVFEATLTRDGVALDLTGAQSVTLRYWQRGATTSVTKTMTVTDATAGVAEYAWAVDEPAADGVYDFVVETVLSTGDTLACPNGNGWGTFTVTPAPPGA